LQHACIGDAAAVSVVRHHVATITSLELTKNTLIQLHKYTNNKQSRSRWNVRGASL